MGDLQVGLPSVTWKGEANRLRGDHIDLAASAACACICDAERLSSPLQVKSQNDLAILTRVPTRIKVAACADESQPVKNSPCVGPDALIALVRLLARQAARECALPAR